MRPQQGGRSMTTEVSAQNLPSLIEARPIGAGRARLPLALLEAENMLQIRSHICRFLVKHLGFSTACCFGLIILQGFHPFGFQMDAGLLKWLCGATIAQSGVLLTIFTKAVWQKRGKSPKKRAQMQP